MKRLRMNLAIAAMSAAVSAASCATEIPDRIPSGDWGGQHIGMVVSDTGALIEYDCAAGRITEPLRLDERGHFQWTGVHIPGHGGPVREDEQVESRPARYTGNATSDRMTLTLTLVDSTQPAQTFTLVRGGAAGVFKCL